MKTTFFFVLLFAISLNISQAQESKNTDVMESLYDSGEFEKLLKLTMEGLKTDSTDFDLLYYSAQSLYQLEYYTDAYYQFSKAIALYPDSSVLYNNRGQLLLSVKEFEAAYEDYNNELRLAKSDKERKSAYLNIAAAQLSVRELEEAIETLTKAYQIDSTDIGVLINLSYAYSDLGEKQKAIEYLEESIRIDPDFFPSITNLGFIHMELEQYDKALYYFNKVLEKNEDDPFTLNNRGFAKFKTGQTKAALKDINKSIKLSPGNPYAFKNRALILLELGKKNEACEDLHTALAEGFTIMYGEEVNQLIEKHCK